MLLIETTRPASTEFNYIQAVSNVESLFAVRGDGRVRPPSPRPALIALIRFTVDGPQRVFLVRCGAQLFAEQHRN